MSQPALSAQVQQVEELLGVKVFERDRRKVLLTETGRDIVTRARAILAQVDALAHAAHANTEPLAGPLHLGVIPTVAPYLLPYLLPAVRDEFPQLHLVLREDQTARLVTRLGEGSLDVLLLALPVDAVFVETMSLFDEPFVLAVPSDDELASSDAVTEAALRSRTVLLLDDGHCLRDQALQVCASAGATESENVRATSLSTLVQMVANGLGITLLPELAIPVEVVERERIAIRRFDDTTPKRIIGLMWRAASPRESEFRMLGKLIREIHVQALERVTQLLADS